MIPAASQKKSALPKRRAAIESKAHGRYPDPEIRVALGGTTSSDGSESLSANHVAGLR